MSYVRQMPLWLKENYLLLSIVVNIQECTVFFNTSNAKLLNMEIQWSSQTVLVFFSHLFSLPFPLPDYYTPSIFCFGIVTS